MGQLRRGVLGISALAALAVAMPAPASASSGSLDMYETDVNGEQLSALNTGGFDIASVEPGTGGASHVDLVLSDADRAALARDGIEVELLRDTQGRTVSERAASQAKGGYKVFHDYDGNGGIADQLQKIARKYPKLTRLETIGRSGQGRKILAMRLTRESSHPKDGGKPSVLYQGTTHAREWISTEVTMRALRWFLAHRNAGEARKLLSTRDLWFLPVVNPDGYQYTFDHERLWRKTLRDNDGDGKITNEDGVDPNRNYPERWAYDDEGSATIFSDDTFHGPRAASEPEVRADMKLVRQIDPVFAISYHSFGPLLLYPQGWQVETPTADDPIYEALSGNPDKPAVKGFVPEVAAQLYTTNGEFTDWAHAEQGVLAWTTELDEGCKGCGFVFPDNEKKVQHEFQINRPFILDLARSAANPAHPKSHLGNKTKPLYLSTTAADPNRTHNPSSDFRFAYSYGGIQPVQVLAQRGVGKVKVSYEVNNGPTKTAKTAPAKLGERFGLNDYGRYYHELRGEVPAAGVGDQVKVWFTSGRARTASFTYTVVNAEPSDVLIVAAEDYSGISSSTDYADTTGPSYLSYYEDALAASGRTFDVYDVDARNRTAPDDLGVLGHYKAVVYYTGNDLITREATQTAGDASRLANDEMLELRSYLNQGGKLLYGGQYAGYEYSLAYPFDPVANGSCNGTDDAVAARCQFLSDDFLQYYLGAGIYNDDAGTVGATDDTPGTPVDVAGSATPYDGMSWTFNGGDSAANQTHTASFLTTSSLLSEGQYPQFAGDARASYIRSGAAPFEPFDGSRYVYSGRSSNSFKRLSHQFDLTSVAPADANLSFEISYDTELSYDHVIVEAHHVGEDDWTTLPDVNGHTTPDVGESCPEGWTEDLHPFIKHYETFNGSKPCDRTGTTGEWNSATGRSAGWENWTVDLSGYAGSKVEVSITYVSDYSVQGAGAFVDDISTGFGEGTTSFEDDSAPLAGWKVPGAPKSSPGNANDWGQTGSLGYEEGAVVSTPDTLYFGFGLEGITNQADRREVMARSMDYLLGS